MLDTCIARNAILLVWYCSPVIVYPTFISQAYKINKFIKLKSCLWWKGAEIYIFFSFYSQITQTKQNVISLFTRKSSIRVRCQNLRRKICCRSVQYTTVVPLLNNFDVSSFFGPASARLILVSHHCYAVSYVLSSLRDNKNIYFWS